MNANLFKSSCKKISSKFPTICLLFSCYFASTTYISHLKIDRTRACPSSKSTMEELRAKRLQRERDERRKADLLLGKVVLQSDAAHKKQYNPAR